MSDLDLKLAGKMEPTGNLLCLFSKKTQKNRDKFNGKVTEVRILFSAGIGYQECRCTGMHLASGSTDTSALACLMTPIKTLACENATASDMHCSMILTLSGLKHVTPSFN